MKTAFIVFDRVTALDLIGIYDPLTRLDTMHLMPGFEWDVCAFASPVGDDRGLPLAATLVGQPLSGYDLIVVPGGLGTRPLHKDQAFLDWLRTAEPVKLKVSVCTGALLLGAAGFLRGKKATTHPSAFDLLRPYCAQVVDERVVDEGEVITARGVTSAIDAGLYVVERLAGAQARSLIARQMDYPYVWESTQADQRAQRNPML
jgi:transcriptional regulator GlxA family with amidase domain